MARTIQVGEKAFGNGEFQPIPVGTKLRMAVFDIDETVVNSGDNKGKPQAVVTFKVTEDGEYKGRELRYNNVPLYGDGNNAWVLVSFAQAVGWKAERGEDLEIPDNLSTVLGTEIVGTVGQRASTKENPATGQPYINNTVTRYAKLKPGEQEVDKPKAKTWGSV